jgi:CubicO group peptidase (beta-lactamase class C family)
MSDMANDIETTFQAAIDAGKINGAVICATNADGRFVYDKALGERTLLSGEKRPQQLDDVLYLASATKLMATIAALQCVEDGLLTLTGDLSSIAPELASKQVLGGFSGDGDTPLLEPQASPITLEMLLTHSAGTPYHFLTPHVARWKEKFPSPLGDGRKSVEELYYYPLSFQPGTSWMYSSGLDWAGRIVERVTGLTLGERMQQRMFDPLGFDDAQFYPVTREGLRSRLVDLNPDDPGALGLAVVGGGATSGNSSTRGDFGGHGLFMSGPSYVKVLRSLLANDGKLLKPSTVDDMFQHHLSPQATAGHQAALASPMGVFFRVGVDPEIKLGYGLGGLLTLQDADGFYGEGTLTWGGGRTFTWFIDRKNGLCGIRAIQVALPFDNNAVETLKGTLAHDFYRKYGAWKEQQQAP